jgi:hypothetical protein
MGKRKGKPGRGGTEELGRPETRRGTKKVPQIFTGRVCSIVSGGIDAPGYPDVFRFGSEKLEVDDVKKLVIAKSKTYLAVIYEMPGINDLGVHLPFFCRQSSTHTYAVSKTEYCKTTNKRANNI